ncbi:uncharacterized protein [Rutidosis leptorrhynchoides]|uniref:uncharacterized protein isoform X2 n=1 Tax=Rutidosis leptorrhynchoides TaxID=125765 RepID=UPI003A99DCD8
MYGRLEGELWFNRWHMWPVPSSSTPSVAAPQNSFISIDTNSFSKDGRKINVGDCALFKPLNSSLPFVGKIRKLIVEKESSPSLSVNWLYRPADVKLKEGALLEAAPNEIFYSFHEDEIPAASLLHPCKVTFFRKGFELPSGTFSFVCRRVYDIEGECLWWLTDRDYINERQEEVNQLLDKTHIDMYGASLTGGRSPKPVNGPNGTAQLKHSSDNLQNSSSSITSNAKSKKREHGIYNLDSVKRECLSKVEDADSGQHRPENTIKTEIARITDKAGLIDTGGVEKLIQLMRPDNAEKKLDLASRTMLVDVISITDRFDCLGTFVQLKGLSVLDEWLQEIHKGKIGNGNGISKGNDKSVEDFLFSLLRALEKLPVNLHALQTCNVGKSVNHLRSHKNSEIQNKARSLVSTWKRRVEAEMNIIETKSGTSRGGSWSNKSTTEVSPLGSRRAVSNSDVGPTLKSQQLKHNNSSEAVTKSPTSPVSTKLSPSSATKEGRSCSSSQSPNNSQSFSSEHVKTGTSSVCKIYNSSSHSKNSSNGFHASTNTGAQKEVGKSGSTRQTSERTSDVSHLDNGNSPRLIVRLPNSVRSPTRNVNVESFEDSSTISGKGYLPVPPEKPTHVKSESLQANSVPKDGLVSHNEQPVNNDGHEERTNEASFGSGSSSGVIPEPGKLYEASYSSINALVESCVKFSEASVSPPVVDDVGMNLLASVAAGEMSRSDEDDVSVANGQSVDSLSTKGESQQPVSRVGTRVSGDSSCELKTDEDNTLSNLPTADNDNVMALEVEPSCLMEDTSCCKETKNIVVQSDADGIRAKVETHNNDDSASWSSSDMRQDEKRLVLKRSSSNNLATNSHCNADIAPKSEDANNNEHFEVNIEKYDKAPASATQELRSTKKSTDMADVNGVEMAVKLDFDLNDEVLPSDDGIQGEVDRSSIPSPSPFSSSNSPVTENRSTLITVAAAAKGPFYPSENLLRGKAELGWKGSAATSAFRPAEPRKPDFPVPDNRTSKPARPLLDFDLNVGVDDDSSQNVTPSTCLDPVNRPFSGGRLDLDLNACEDSADVSGRPSMSLLSGRPNSSRDFDLNNGPGAEDVGGESVSVSFSKNSRQFMSSGPNVRMNNNNMDIGNFSTWFSPNNTYPAITIPSVLPGRGEQSYTSQRILTPVTASTSHNPAVAFQPTVPFQHSAFPFETNFPMPSVSNVYSSVSTGYVDTSSSGRPVCFSTIPPQPQLVGPNGVVSMPYRPYFMSLPGGSNLGADGRKWASNGLDLNAGLGGGGGTDDKLSSVSRQIPLVGSQAMADEQLKMLQQMAAGSKRKDPDSGWDGDRLSYKHPSWQ